MKLVQRAQWGARAPTNVTPLTSGLKGMAFHYSAADADEQSLHGHCAGRVKGIQRYHMETKKWNDIAYNFLVCKHGYVFVGRGFGVRSAANGTNASNSSYYAVCFLGDDSKGRDDVTNDGRQALVDIRREMLGRYPAARLTVGHRDVNSTTCPGDEIYAFLKSDGFKAATREKEVGSLPGPSPKTWEFWAWANWKRTKPPRGPRPVPLAWVAKNATWCWRALAAWNKAHP